MSAPGAEGRTEHDRPTRLDLTRLAEYLVARRPDLLAGPLRAALFTGGRSNLTYLLGCGQREFRSTAAPPPTRPTGTGEARQAEARWTRWVSSRT